MSDRGRWWIAQGLSLVLIFVGLELLGPDLSDREFAAILAFTFAGITMGGAERK